MGLETVLTRIRESGEAEASAIVDEGRKERERLLAEVRADGAKLRARREAEAMKQAERRRVQDLARAELDARKIVLSACEEVLVAVRERAKARLAASSDAEALRRLLTKHAAEWRSGRVFCSPKDADVVRSVVGRCYAGTIDCVGGFVVESADGTRRLDLTFDSVLRGLWNDVVKEVAQTLWPR